MAGKIRSSVDAVPFGIDAVRAGAATFIVVIGVIGGKALRQDIGARDRPDIEFVGALRSKPPYGFRVCVDTLFDIANRPSRRFHARGADEARTA